MPGLSADIIIDKRNDMGKAIAVPTKAVVFSNNKSYVLHYKSDCEIEAKVIEPLASKEGFVYIKEGLSAKDKVISSNALIIYENLNQ